jgi:hypothetical protein
MKVAQKLQMHLNVKCVWGLFKAGLNISARKIMQQHHHIALLEEQCHNSKNPHFELCSQEVYLRLYLPSGRASHVYFLKWPWEGRSVTALLMWLHRPSQWFFLSPEKLYFSSCGSVLLAVRYVIKDYENGWQIDTRHSSLLNISIKIKHFQQQFL